MTNQNKQTDKDARKERFQRRRGRASLEDDQQQQPRRRREPYKREQMDYDDYLNEEEDWRQAD